MKPQGGRNAPMKASKLIGTSTPHGPAARQADQRRETPPVFCHRVVSLRPLRKSAATVRPLSAAEQRACRQVFIGELQPPSDWKIDAVSAVRPFGALEFCVFRSNGDVSLCTSSAPRRRAKWSVLPARTEEQDARPTNPRQGRPFAVGPPEISRVAVTDSDCWVLVSTGDYLKYALARRGETFVGSARFDMDMASASDNLTSFSVVGEYLCLISSAAIQCVPLSGGPIMLMPIGRPLGPIQCFGEQEIVFSFFDTASRQLTWLEVSTSDDVAQDQQGSRSDAAFTQQHRGVYLFQRSTPVSSRNVIVALEASGSILVLQRTAEPLYQSMHVLKLQREPSPFAADQLRDSTLTPLIRLLSADGDKTLTAVIVLPRDLPDGEALTAVIDVRNAKHSPTVHRINWSELGSEKRFEQTPITFGLTSGDEPCSCHSSSSPTQYCSLKLFAAVAPWHASPQARGTVAIEVFGTRLTSDATGNMSFASQTTAPPVRAPQSMLGRWAQMVKSAFQPSSARAGPATTPRVDQRTSARSGGTPGTPASTGRGDSASWFSSDGALDVSRAWPKMTKPYGPIITRVAGRDPPSGILTIPPPSGPVDGGRVPAAPRARVLVWFRHEIYVLEVPQTLLLPSSAHDQSKSRLTQEHRVVRATNEDAPDSAAAPET